MPSVVADVKKSLGKYIDGWKEDYNQAKRYIDDPQIISYFNRLFNSGEVNIAMMEKGEQDAYKKATMEYWKKQHKNIEIKKELLKFRARLFTENDYEILHDLLLIYSQLDVIVEDKVYNFFYKDTLVNLREIKEHVDELQSKRDWLYSTYDKVWSSLSQLTTNTQQKQTQGTKEEAILQLIEHTSQLKDQCSEHLENIAEEIYKRLPQERQTEARLESRSKKGDSSGLVEVSLNQGQVIGKMMGSFIKRIKMQPQGVLSDENNRDILGLFNELRDAILNETNEIARKAQQVHRDFLNYPDENQGICLRESAAYDWYIAEWQHVINTKASPLRISTRKLKDRMLQTCLGQQLGTEKLQSISDPNKTGEFNEIVFNGRNRVRRCIQAKSTGLLCTMSLLLGTILYCVCRYSPLGKKSIGIAYKHVVMSQVGFITTAVLALGVLASITFYLYHRYYLDKEQQSIRNRYQIETRSTLTNTRGWLSSCSIRPRRRSASTTRSASSSWCSCFTQWRRNRQQQRPASLVIVSQSTSPEGV